MNNNKIIDVHIHVGEYDLLRDDIKTLLSLNENGRDFNVKEMFNDPNLLGEYLYKNNVVKAFILAEEGPGTNYHITSKFVVDFKNRAKEKYNDIFICIGNINPNVNNNIMKKYKEDCELGIKGYKLYPSDHNFNPLSSNLMELYKNMEENKQILMFHTGETAQKDSIEKYQNPKELEKIVSSFPNLKIIFCHGGKLKYANEMYELLIKYDNLFIDTGFISSINLLKMFPNIEKVSNQILFASDFPGGIKSMKEYIDDYLNMDINKEIIDKIMFNNALKIIDYIK